MGCGSSNAAESSTEASNRNEPQPTTNDKKQKPEASAGAGAKGKQFVDDGVKSHNKYRYKIQYCFPRSSLV